MTGAGGGRRASPGKDPWPVRLLSRLVAERYRADVIGDLLEEHREGRRRPTALAIEVIRAGIATRWQALAALAAGARGRRKADRNIRQSGGAPMFEILSHDVRAAWATLRRSPAFGAAAVLTLAVGTGALLAIFTLVSGTLLAPLPYEAPGRLVHVQGGADGRYAVTMPIHRQVVGQAPSLEETGVWQGWGAVVRSGTPGMERRLGASVSWNYFRLLGVRPVAGRFFGAEDGQPGHAPVVVLSHGAWQQLFGGRPSAIGEDLAVEEERYTVVGVAPPGFIDPVAAHVWGTSEGVSFWRADPPVFAAAADDGGWTAFWSLARARAGVEPAHVRTELVRIMSEVHPSWEDDGEWLRVASFREVATGHLRPTLAILFAAGCLVLLIACANVANLLLSRGTIRAREMSIRSSLGASRWRLLRQLFVENLVLSAAAVVVGVALSLALTPLLADLLSADLRPGQTAAFDWRVGALAIAMVVLTALVFGLLPALRSSEARLGGVLRLSRGAEQGGGRARGVLIAGEVALGVVVLASATLLGRTLLNLWSTDPGFDAEASVVTYVSLPSNLIETTAEQNATVESIEREVSALPGVRGVGIITDLPMSGAVNSTGIGRPGAPETRDQVLVRAVSPGYFEAMGVPSIRGRGIQRGDTPESTPIAVINQGYAARLPDGGLGQTVVVRGSPRQIVGVVADVVEFRLQDGTGDPVLYTPYAQEAQAWMRTGFSLVARTPFTPGIDSAVRAAVARANPAALVSSRVRPLVENIANDLSEYRFRALLLAFFATMALLLAAAGISAVTAYAVSRQRAEIGIRMALGATGGVVVREIVGRFAVVAATGLAAGLVGAFAAGRSLSHLLVGVPATDPTAFAVAALVFALVAVLASWIPAQRAAAVDPIRALRAE